MPYELISVDLPNHVGQTFTFGAKQEHYTCEHAKHRFVQDFVPGIPLVLFDGDDDSDDVSADCLCF